MCFMLGLTKEISLEKIKSPREKRLFFFISIMAAIAGHLSFIH